VAFDRAAFYDAELRRHQEHFRAALQVGVKDRILDIGCGAGLTTREAASIALEGSAVGVDVSSEMLAIARRRSAEAGLCNITFELGDAETFGFAPSHFDLCISRFGTMFFANPVAAFTNIGRALRHGARLVHMVWQGREHNEWVVAIHEALGSASPANVAPAFSLGDRAVTTRILTASGFDSIEFIDVHAPVFYGQDVDAAEEAVVALFLSQNRAVDAGAATNAVLTRLRALLAAHATADGVWFDSRAWIVSARRTGESAADPA
jgi:SAM-dependent methyltransferase